MTEYDGSRGYGSSGDRDPLEMIGDVLRKRGIILTPETQVELRIALGDSTPQPNTKDEWKNFARLWIDGAELQWFDRSPDADHEWFDFKKDDAWYPYDENLVIRVKTIEKERR